MEMGDFNRDALDQEAIEIHRRNRGKVEIRSKMSVRTPKDLSLAYTPGVAAVCLEIKANVHEAYELTGKGNTIAVVTDGSAVLGLGNIGPEAAMPVMEGKCILFKELAGVDAFPICLRTQKTEEIVLIVKNIAPGLGGINLEDIAAPRCFEVEEALQDIGIPVFHDDQHGTAIVVIAALINAAKVLGKNLADLSVVINGAGASAIACAKLMLGIGFHHHTAPLVKSVILCDSKGILSPDRTDLNAVKQEMTKVTNLERLTGGLKEAIQGRDIFIGLSIANCVTQEMIRSMAPEPIVFAMANPIPEIFPEEARAGGAGIIGTGRSDFPNQINNVLAFPGVFRGALDSKATRITAEMKLAAAQALAASLPNPTVEEILPYPLDPKVVPAVADAVARTARETGMVR